MSIDICSFSTSSSVLSDEFLFDRFVRGIGRLERASGKMNSGAIGGKGTHWLCVAGDGAAEAGIPNPGFPAVGRNVFCG